ncbi:MAG: radical SAM protein [Candidatus Riflebacteria bacterium]|nr:radical SAM protein [Candidatus Riflebacteria bacterium]
MQKACEWPLFSVDLEISLLCDNSCIFCPREKILRPSGLMKSGDFSIIADKLISVPSRIALSGMGNPLLNPNWHDFIKTYREMGGKIGIVIPAASVNDEIAEKLLYSRASFVEISFPTLQKELFEKLLPGASFEKCLEAIKNLRKALSKTSIAIVGLKTRMNEDEEPEFKLFWKEEGFQPRFFSCHTRGGNLEDRDLIFTESSSSNLCGLTCAHTFIDWQGNVLICCHDLIGNTRLANILEDPVEKILQIKGAFFEKLPPYAICRTCDEPARFRPIPAGKLPESSNARNRFLKNWPKKKHSF